jgi:hypothetical protein
MGAQLLFSLFFSLQPDECNLRELLILKPPLQCHWQCTVALHWHTASSGSEKLTIGYIIFSVSEEARKPVELFIKIVFVAAR